MLLTAGGKDQAVCVAHCSGFFPGVPGFRTRKSRNGEKLKGSVRGVVGAAGSIDMKVIPVAADDLGFISKELVVRDIDRTRDFRCAPITALSTRVGLVNNEASDKDYEMATTIKKGTTRKDALAYLHRSHALANLLIMQQAQDEVASATSTAATKDVFIQACHSIPDPEDTGFEERRGNETALKINLDGDEEETTRLKLDPKLVEDLANIQFAKVLATVKRLFLKQKRERMPHP